ncbi:hypothetical protein [Sutcliffiella sp. NC1]|nr:hypothetical protein [Sutcliffiella sp. NC1]WBL17541.1 hypothetical protein O1A01_09910 [Sutcliffiella sp. NC1]
MISFAGLIVSIISYVDRK